MVNQKSLRQTIYQKATTRKAEANISRQVQQAQQILPDVSTQEQVNPLQSQISEIERRLNQINERFQQIQNEEARGVPSRSFRYERQSLGEEATQLGSQLSILQTSGSSQEASQRISAFRYQSSQPSGNTSEYEKAIQNLREKTGIVNIGQSSATLSEGYSKYTKLFDTGGGIFVSGGPIAQPTQPSPSVYSSSGETRFNMDINPSASISDLRKMGLTDSEISEIKYQSISPTSNQKTQPVFQRVVGWAGSNIVEPAGGAIVKVAKFVGGVPIASPDFTGTFKLSTLGQEAERLTSGFKKVETTSGEGWREIGTTFSGDVGKLYKIKGIPTTKEVYIPETEFPAYSSGTGMYNPKTGKFEPQKITISETTETRPTFLGRIPGVIEKGTGGIAFATEQAPTLISWTVAPYAMAGTELLSLGEQSKKINKLAEDEFNKVWKDYQKTEVGPNERLLTKAELKTEVFSQLKEGIQKQQNVNAALTVGFLGGFETYERGIKPLIKSTTAAGKFLSEAEVMILRGGEELVINPVTGETIIPKISGIEDKGIINFFKTKVSKGKDISFEYYPKESVPINIEEQRNVPSSFFRVLGEKVGLVSPKLKTFRGSGALSEGGYKETMFYQDSGKFYKKVTKVGKKGKGTSTLFKREGEGWQEIKKIETISSEPFAVNYQRPRKEKIVLDEEYVQPFIKLEVQRGGKKITKILARAEAGGGEVVDLSGQPIKTDLSSAKITGGIETISKKGKNIKEGYFSIQAQDYFWSDVAGSGPRKGLIRNKGLTIRKQVGQNIVYGTPNEKDVSMKVFGVEKRSISPKFTRFTEEGTRARFAEIKINPKSKLLNPEKELERLKKIEIKNQLIQIEKHQKQFEEEWIRRKGEELYELENQGIKTRIQNLKNRFKKPAEPGIITYEAPSYVGGGQLQELPQSKLLPPEFTKLDLTEEFVISPPKLKGNQGFSSLKTPSYSLDLTSETRRVPFMPVKVNTRQELVTTRQNIKSEQVLKIKNVSLLKTEPMLKLEQRPRLRLEQIPILKTEPMLKLEQRPILKLEQIPMLKLEQSMRQVQRRPVEFTERRPTPTKPGITIIKLPKQSKGIYVQKGKGEEKVIPYVRRRGKYAPVGPAMAFEEAFGLGVGRLRTTLGASLQLRGAKTGKLYPIAKETPEFRAGKKGKDIFTLVQRAPRRLSSRQERIEIIQSRGGIKWY